MYSAGAICLFALATAIPLGWVDSVLNRTVADNRIAISLLCLVTALIFWFKRTRMHARVSTPGDMLHIEINGVRSAHAVRNIDYILIEKGTDYPDDLYLVCKDGNKVRIHDDDGSAAFGQELAGLLKIKWQAR